LTDTESEVFLALLFALLSGQPQTPSTQGMLDRINVERSIYGVRSLGADACLGALARERASDMATRRYFGHVTPDGRTPWDVMRADGCAFHYAAENIAQAPNAAAAIEELWKSPEHRRNTLDPHYAKIGIGAARLGDGTELFVEDFTD
jgi:uncharacterized protein YkwD